jgi:hypothetical protein
MNIFDPAFGKRKRLRFTGENPSPDLWREFPNWRNALEEEGEAGQDETTLMPDEEQSCVARFTAFTGGSVRFHDGREFPAFIAVNGEDEKISGVDVYESAKPWRLYFDYPERRWRPYAAEWMPAAERSPVVSMEDERIFPLEVRMHVPWKKGGRPPIFEITARGAMRTKENA